MSDRPELEIDRQVPVERTSLGDGRSWVDLSRGVLRRPDELFEHLLDTASWSQGAVWRYERYVEERRLGAAVPHDEITALRQMKMHVESRYRVRLGAPAVILYRDGNDFQALHSDRQMKWLDETLIAILVLGAERPFRLRPRGDWRDPEARADSSRDVVLRPGHGDLLVMGGRCQRDWLHAVPEDTITEPRISVSWRWTSRRGRPDTGPAYNDGVHYSDRPRVPGRRFRSVDQPFGRSV